MNVYFNEIDPFAAQWCRNGFPDAVVDDRSIVDITRPVDTLRQHYFAGLGGWEYAVRLAEWPDDWPLWTGSCPCQPFSVAGKGQAHEDERDLWPAFFRLIALGRPSVIVGEQVNGAISYGWLDRVCDDLEGIGYAIGAAVLPACGVGAPHIRQRLFWCAIRLDDTRREPDERLRILGDVRSAPSDQQGEILKRQRDGDADRDPSEADWVAVSEGADRRTGESGVASEARFGWRGSGSDGSIGGVELPALDRREQGRTEPERRSLEPRRDTGRMGDPERARPEGAQGTGFKHERDPRSLGRSGESVGMANSNGAASARHREYGGSRSAQPEPESHWAASGSIYCRDGRWRRVPFESWLQPLADSGRFGNPRADRNLSSRIGALRAAGNAIVIPLAAEFIGAVMDVLIERW